MSNDELMHYSVKGMKWGVRRYSKPKINSKRKQKKLQGIKDQDLKVAKTNYMNSKTYSRRETQENIAIGREWTKNLLKIDVRTASKKDFRDARNKAINYINNMDDNMLKAYLNNQREK